MPFAGAPAASLKPTITTLSAAPVAVTFSIQVTNGDSFTLPATYDGSSSFSVEGITQTGNMIQGTFDSNVGSGCTLTMDCTTTYHGGTWLMRRAALMAMASRRSILPLRGTAA